MTVRVRLSSLLSAYCGAHPEFTLEAGDLAALLGVLEREHPELWRALCQDSGALRPHVNLFVNARPIRELRGVDTPLRDGDLVTIVQAVSGG